MPSATTPNGKAATTPASPAACSLHRCSLAPAPTAATRVCKSWPPTALQPMRWWSSASKPLSVAMPTTTSTSGKHRATTTPSPGWNASPRAPTPSATARWAWRACTKTGWPRCSPTHRAADPYFSGTLFMPRFAANLSMLYNDVDFLDRFAAAARDGFKAVEYLFPYAYPAQELAARLQANGLQQVLFNAPPGNWDGGERGLACLPGREAEFREGIAKAIEYAQALQCPRIHVMAGLVTRGADAAMVRAPYTATVRSAAERAAPHGIQILLEPINGRDMPGFFLSRQDQAHVLIAEIGAPNVKVQMDLYHCQIVEGDLAMKVRQYLPTGNVGHFQIAGVPERHEPDVGEINYTYLFKLLDSLGYDGWIGCEYRPARGTAAHATSDGLGWLQPWL